ncbi:MAG: TonB-dependent receptor [Bryobacterales bacterium]|nr:TonB-dependent receptor [Bryobacterales bacterium]
MSPLLVLAQSDRGTITGRVLDAQSSAIPNVTVVARNQATNVRTETRTNESGVYSLQQLPVGNYEVTAEAPGFRKFVARDLTLNVAQTFGLDIRLELGQVEQTIEVTAGTTALQTATSDLGTTISRDQVMDLPLAVSGNMRNPEAFLFLAPGVTGDVGNTQINGSQSRAKEVLLDGAGATGPESGGTLFTYPSVEVIGEFKLLAANFNAEYGRTGGGFEVFTTRSGSNEIHGALFEYFRNDAFDARGFFSPTTPVNRQNEFGANFSGPVLLPKLYNGKNKTFFFFNYTGFRFRAGQVNQFFTVPTAAMARGDFSGLTDRNGRPLLIYDPATTVSTPEGFTRQPFPGNIIPQERFSAVSRKILPLLPTPTNSRQTDNFLSIGARTFDRDQVNIKIDHAFSDKARVNWFSYIGSQSSVAALGLPIPFTNALDEQRPSRWLRFNFDYIFSPTLLNNFIVGYTREPQLWSKLSANQDWPNRIGLTGINTGPGNVFPRVTFTDGLSTWADDSKNVGAQVNNMLQLNDSLSIVRGKHVFKAGVEARWQQTNGADPFGQQGQFAFSQLETSLPTAAARAITGHAFASFLLGNVDNASYNALVVVPGNRYRYLGTYFQDDWKITRKLTLNLGLRYDIFFPRIERFNNFSSFDPAALNAAAGGRLGAITFLGEGPGRDNSRRSFADTYYRNFGPRFGFAYLLRDKTVLRGGYGIFYAPGNATAGLRQSQRFAIGFNGQPSYQSPDLGVTPGFNWDQGFPTNWPKPPFIDPTVANGTSVDTIGRNDGRPPYFQNWTFNIQHELPGAVVVDLAYVGNKGTRLGNGLININEVDPRYLALGSLLTRPVTSAEAQAAGIALPYAGFTGSIAQALRPYPQYLNIANRSNPNGNSTYHAFQMKAEKRMTRGLTFLGAYTFSKSISDSDIQAGGGPTGLTYYNRRLEKGIGTNDVPHILNLSFLYDLPFGRTKAWGGWSLTGILQYATGKPIVLTATNALPLFNGGNRPDVLSATRTGQQDNFDPAVDLWINPAAFAVPGANRFGTSARSYTDLRAPNFLNESFGLIKRTRLGERANLIFRAEFFNAFNRVVFAAPASNISNQNFGRISAQANTPRQGQLALRLEF